MNNVNHTPLPVLVTAVGGGGHGEQILKALRLANTDGRYRILVADINEHCPQFAWADESFVLPGANHPGYMDALLDVCQKNNIQAVFHGCEAELMTMSRHRDRLKDAGIFLPINPHDVLDLCMDKSKTASFLGEHGFEPPQYVEVTDVAKINEVDFYPVVVKPSTGGGGSADCYIAQGPKELEALSVLLDLENTNQRFLIQEYVGTAENEFTVGVLRDMNGEFINSIALKRVIKSQLNKRLSVPNRTSKVELGEQLVISSGVSHGYIGRYPEVTEVCEEIAELLGAEGAVNIQCRLVNGKVKIFEINPRFSGTTSLRAMVGYNEPDCLIRKHLLGEEIEKRFDYRQALIVRSLMESEVSEPL